MAKNEEFNKRVKKRLEDNYGFNFNIWKPCDLKMFDEIIEATEKEIDIDING